MKDKAITFLATGAGAGYSPLMPGTVGTLWGVVLAFALQALSPAWSTGALLLFVLIAIYVSGEAQKILNKKDPSVVVCDEIVGFPFAVLFMPFTLTNVILGFLLFRFFDILKPFPLREIDRRVPGGAGIVLDDVGAGIYANITGHLIIRLMS